MHECSNDAAGPWCELVNVACARWLATHVGASMACSAGCSLGGNSIGAAGAEHVGAGIGKSASLHTIKYGCWVGIVWFWMGDECGCCFVWMGKRWDGGFCWKRILGVGGGFGGWVEELFESARDAGGTWVVALKGG